MHDLSKTIEMFQRRDRESDERAAQLKATQDALNISRVRTEAEVREAVLEGLKKMFG